MPHRHRAPRSTFATVDDVLLSGRSWLVDGEPRAAVVLSHGFTASADHPEIGYLAAALHERDIDVISYDARGHGRSGGVSTLGDNERHDVAAAVEIARLRADRVVVVGASMGAIAVLRHAAADTGLAGVVSVSCPSRWRVPRSPVGVLSMLMTRTSPGRWMAARYARVRVAPRWTNPVPPIELVQSVQVPLVVVHGTRDRFIPVRDAYELYLSASCERRLEIVDAMGHAFEACAVDRIVQAVEWALSIAGSATAGTAQATSS